ncbi:MAG: class I SAM-dependent methyltransferase, partial [Roseiflexaceae bacterium]|nr:class I SAM-dependent methyltransferase [Roseiflexaceae bacterium]
ALDIACGTGTLALLLADKGWDVVGIDQSAAMLGLARTKADALDAPGTAAFFQADMRNFAGPQPRAFDLATCTYDSLNYLLDERDLIACFSCVAAALRPGGLFVADMNTRHFLEHDWGEVSIAEARGLVEVQRSHFERATDCSTMLLSGFVGCDEQGYTRFDETHVERAYPPDTVALLLEQAGLHVEAAYDCFTLLPHYPASQRIAWVARKRGFAGAA